MDNGPDSVMLIDLKASGRLTQLLFSNDFKTRVDPATVRELGLSKGCRLTADEFERVRGILEERHALMVAQTLLAGRAYSIGEFRLRLKKKEISRELIDKITGEFRERGLLDDYRYAIGKIQTLLEHRPAGQSYLKAYLQNRLVPRPIAEKATKEACSQISETDIAVRLLSKKRTTLEKFDLETARRKAYNYLSRRGISYRAAKEAFDRLFMRARD